MLDPSQLFPTFLTLLRIPDPRNWLAAILPSSLVNVLRNTFKGNTSLSVAAARKSIALRPDHCNQLDSQLCTQDDNSSILLVGDTVNSTSPALIDYKRSTPSERSSSKMTQIYTEDDQEFGELIRHFSRSSRVPGGSLILTHDAYSHRLPANIAQLNNHPNAPCE